MTQKIRTAFIYKQSNPYMSGNAWATTYYHFFMDALRRNSSLETSYFPAENSFDVSALKNNFDIILLWENHPWGTPDNLVGIETLDIPVICRVNDAQDVHDKGKIAYHKKYKIDHYFGYLPESYFYKYYPQEFKYKVILYGLEPSLYANVTPFEERIKDKILCTGAIGRIKLGAKLKEYLTRRELRSNKHYRLRTKCTQLSYVDYTPTLQHEYINDKYPLLLNKYAASIAACTSFPVIKYWESAAAGCLTFMEVTEKNKADMLGFTDEENAIFINEKNYKKKLQEFINDVDNPKWEEIAKAGREYTMKNLTNDIAAESLVLLMKELINN